MEPTIPFDGQNPIPGAPTQEQFAAAEQQALMDQLMPQATTVDPNAFNPNPSQGFNPNAQAIDPNIVKVAQDLLGQYGSYEAMQAAIQQQEIQAAAETAKAQAEQSVNAQFGPAIQNLQFLKQQVDEGLIEQSVYTAQESALKTAYNATLAQAKQFAEMQPQLQAFQAAQTRQQEQAKIQGQVNTLIQSNPALRGAEGLLEVQLRQGIDPQSAANAIMAVSLNRNANMGMIPAPRVPASLPFTQQTTYGARQPQIPSVVDGSGNFDPAAAGQIQQLIARMTAQANQTR